MVQIVLVNVKVEIGMTDTQKILQFTDADSKIVVTVPIDRLTATQIGQQLAGSITLATNGGANGR